MGLVFLAERPTWPQWSGVISYFMGILTYFYPLAFSIPQIIGILVVVIGVIANASSVVLGRSINRERNIPIPTMTTVNMDSGH